jgi:hypothetical protein
MVAGGVRSDDEMSLYSSSSAVASALSKRAYQKITGHTDHTASVIGGGAGRRGPQESAITGDSDSALLPVPGKKKRRGAGYGTDTNTDTGTGVVTVVATVSVTDLQPLETVAELSRARVDFTIADLGAEIMREMEKVERIAVVSRNLKGTVLRRLRLASRRVRASSAELQQRTVATSAVALTMADLCRLRIRDGGVDGDDARIDVSEGMELTDKDEGPSNGPEHTDGAYLRGRVRSLESEVRRLQETVKRLTEECAKRRGKGETFTTVRGKRRGPPLLQRGGRKEMLPGPQRE